MAAADVLISFSPEPRSLLTQLLILSRCALLEIIVAGWITKAVGPTLNAWTRRCICSVVMRLFFQESYGTVASASRRVYGFCWWGSWSTRLESTFRSAPMTVTPPTLE
jgi:hypothetical protein